MRFIRTINIISFFLLMFFIMPGCANEQKRMDSTNEVVQIRNQQEKSEYEKEIESFNIRLEEFTSSLDSIDDIDNNISRCRR